MNKDLNDQEKLQAETLEKINDIYNRNDLGVSQKFDLIRELILEFKQLD